MGSNGGDGSNFGFRKEEWKSFPTITLGCDNDTAMYTTFMTRQPNCRDAHSDILKLIHWIRDRIDTKINPIITQGHLDEEIQFKNLDRNHQLNLMCDKLAKETREAFPIQRYGNRLLPIMLMRERDQCKSSNYKWSSCQGKRCL